MRSTVTENIMEHSEQVAQIVHALATINNIIFEGNIDANKLVTMAVFHEASEVITGDLPTPIKYFNQDIKIAYKSLESIANEKLISMLPKELQHAYTYTINIDTESIEYKFLKSADKLAAYIKCLEEVSCGNNEFSKALKTLKKDLDDNILPEVEYFITNFISAFSKTLDELE